VPSQYQIGSTLGRGTFGLVMALDEKVPKQVHEAKALKTMVYRETLWKDWGNLFREVYMPTWLRKHPSMKGNMIAAVQMANAAFQHASVLLPRYGCNMIQQSINTASNYLKHFTPPEIKKWDLSPQYILKASECRRMFQILFALKEVGVLHGDAKPDQFLCDEKTNTISLADFGCCGFVDAGTAIVHQNALLGTAQCKLHLPQDLLQARGGWITREPIRFFPSTMTLSQAMPWFDIWCLDLYLSRGGFSILDDLDPKKVSELRTDPYLRLSSKLFPWDVEQSLLSQCVGGACIEWINERKELMCSADEDRGKLFGW
jgi:serine/threonine protein kinase